METSSITSGFDRFDPRLADLGPFGYLVLTPYLSLLLLYTLMDIMYYPLDLGSRHCTILPHYLTITYCYTIIHNAQELIIRGQNHSFRSNHSGSGQIWIWGSEDLRIWNLGISGSGILGSGDLRIWDLGIWRSQDLGSWDLGSGVQIPQI